MKFQRNIILAFLLLTLTGAFLWVQQYDNKKEADKTREIILQSQNSLNQTHEFGMQVLNLESELRGYVITGNKSFLSNTDDEKKILFNQLSNFKKNASQKEIVNSLENLLHSKINFQDNVIGVYSTSPDEAFKLIATLKGKLYTDSIMNMLRKLQNEKRGILQQRINQSNKIILDRYMGIAAIGLICFILISFALWKINQEARWRRFAEKNAGLNEKKYQTLIENSSLLMYTTDEAGFFTFVGINSLKLTGYKKEELLGNHFSILIPDDRKEYVLNFYKNQFKKFISETTLQFSIITKKGHLKWVDQSTVLLQTDNYITGFQSTVKDITAIKSEEDFKKESEEKFSEQREEGRFRLQAILDNIPMTVYIKDLEGRFILVNKLFRETYNLSENEVIGNTVSKVESDSSKVEKYIMSDNKVIETKQSYEFEELKKTTGAESHLLITKFPLFDRDNNLFGVCGVDKDITEIVRTRKKLLAAKIKAEKAEQLQEEFLANMSHEIRTPMNGVIGMTNLLLTTELSEVQRDYTEVIKHSSDILMALINDILDLSKIKVGRMEIEVIDFNLREALETVYLPIKYKLDENVQCKITVDEKIPHHVSGDLHKLVQILNNLMGNAVKFTAIGEIKLDVKVVSQSDKRVVIEFIVTDTGIGIGEEILPGIFNSFEQGSINIVRKFGGSGLGLTITKRLVEMQGGSLEVRSEIGKGSIFSFQMPYTVSTAEKSNAVKNSFIDINKDFNLSGKKILLVEDNLVNQKVVVSTLKNLGVVCTVANNGKEAVVILEKEKPFDAILMDLQMPEMDGLQTTIYIRQKLKISTPIIAITASALRNEKARCLEVGMNAYMSKPFAPEMLVHNLKMAMQMNITAEVDYKDKEVKIGLYNLEYLEQLGDAASQKEVLQLLLDSTPVLIANLKSTLLHEEWEGVGKNAHELKSNVGILQIQGILKNANAIETRIKKEKYDEIGILVAKIDQEFNLVKLMIESEITELK